MRKLRPSLFFLPVVIAGVWWVFQSGSADEQGARGEASSSIANGQALSSQLIGESESSAKSEQLVTPASSSSVPAAERPPSTLLPVTGDEDSETRDLASYLGFDQFMALEPVDPSWAPLMEATLDSTVRAMGGPVRDVVVRCLTTQCRVAFLYHPSYFFEDDPDARNAGQLAVGNAFVEAVQPVLQAYPELRIAGGSPQVQVSPQAPAGTDLEAPFGTIFQDSGIVAGVFKLSKAPLDSD